MAQLGRWEAKLVEPLLATAALWVRFQTSLKNTKGRHKQRISQHTVARQKIFSYLAGMSPYISLKIKKRHYEHHMIEAHKYLITWISDDISFENSG